MLFNFLIFNVFYFLFFNFNFVFNFNFFLILIFFFLLNYFFLKNLNNFNSNLDLCFKYFKFFTKHFFSLVNIIYFFFKKFYNFVYIKFFIFLKSLSKFFNIYLKNVFIIWRPLFKKWSYFGYYRINRSKWIK